MALSQEYLDYLCEQLEGLGPVAVKKMFGGAGLYVDGTIFGLVADEVFYLKVDSQNQPDYEQALMTPFKPFEDKPTTMSYWQVPDWVLDDPEELCAWARKAWEAGRRAQAKKKSKSSRKSKG